MSNNFYGYFNLFSYFTTNLYILDSKQSNEYIYFTMICVFL